MSVAISDNNNQNQVLGLDDESKNPILKGKHVKDGKEILQEIVKDTTEAKAKIAEHLTQVMLEMKKAGLGDPLKPLSQNPSWQNFVSTDLFNRKPTTKADEMNMYMEIFKALEVSSKASNVDLADKCAQMIVDTKFATFIQKGADQDLADMQKTMTDNYNKYEDAKSHESFWDKLCDIIAPILAVVAFVAAVTVAVVIAPETGGASLLAVGFLAGGLAGAGMGFLAQGLSNKKDNQDMTDATGAMETATVNLSFKTSINGNSISALQNQIENTTSQTQNFENDKESIDSVKSSVIKAMAQTASSN